MADVASITEIPWAAPTAVALGPHGIVWDIGTLVTSLGGAYTPGAPPVGGTPTLPNTDADFTIGPGPFYYVEHVAEVVDLRDDTNINLESVTIACDDGSVCWTLSASGNADLFQRFTTGAVPVIEIALNGNTWRFVVEGVQRSREFASTGVGITGRSLTIIAGEPYQFPQNWVNDGPATALQLADQAQVFTGLEVDFQLDDWLVPDRAFTFTGSPLAVVARVAESVGAVMRADRVENRISLLPRYRVQPNEWREQVPEVEIHLDIVRADAYERADKPAYNGVYVAGQADGQIARIYLSGTSGDKLAPMVTDALLTEQIALRQRGESILGQGGPQAVVRITLPVLNEAGFPGVFELSWLCRIVEPGLIWYGVVRAVTVTFEFGRVSQTITLERHTADIDGTTVSVPPPPPPPTLALGWRDPINGTSGTVTNVTSGHTFNFMTTGPAYYGVHVEASALLPTTWALTWTPEIADAAPTLTVSPGAGAVVTLTYPEGFSDLNTSRGVALLIPSVDGVELSTRLRLESTSIDFGETTDMTWSVEQNP